MCGIAFIKGDANHSLHVFLRLPSDIYHNLPQIINILHYTNSICALIDSMAEKIGIFANSLMKAMKIPE